MFDISWSELLILGIVTLVFVGPKELPVFLRTIGKYVGMVKRQAGEFREQFDTAMREAEFEQIRKDMMGVKTDVESTMRDAGRSVESEFDGMKSELDKAAQGGPLVDPATDAQTFDPDAHDSDGIPIPRPAAPQAAATAASATSPAKAAADAADAADAAAEAARAANPPAVLPPQTADAMKSGV